ncbi:MAG: hypothetical protein ACK5LF_21335 [Bacteroides xylanisolvens]
MKINPSALLLSVKRKTALFAIWLKLKKKKCIKLTVRAIIRWEQINGKPFSQMNYEKEDDVISLFYVCDLRNTKKTLAEYKAGLTERLVKKMVSDIDRQTVFTSQFEDKKQNEPSEYDADNSEEPSYMKDIISLLVMSGLDVRYALDEMELCDISLFTKAYEKSLRNKMESQRHEIFWMLSPNLSKSVKSAKDLYTFPWEIEKPKIKTKAEQEAAEKVFESFFTNGLSL